MFVQLDIDYGLIGDTHHSGSELQRAHCFFEVACFRPDISHHDRFAIASEGVSQEISKARLTVRNVITNIRGKGDDNLFEKGKTLVNKGGLLECQARRSGLLGALGPCKIHEMELRSDYLI